MDNSTHFPTVNDALGKTIIAKAQKITLPIGITIFRQGSSCENFLLVTQGKVKVFTRASNGREIVLYRVEPGQSCTLTTSCLLANNDYPAEGITETAVNALVLSLADFTLGLDQSSSFRQFVFNTYGSRLCEVISLVNEVNFNRIDIRLAKQLINQVDHQQQINKTHQEIATELGSAREVISRQLKLFADKNWVTLSRGQITLTAQDKLKILANTQLV